MSFETLSFETSSFETITTEMHGSGERRIGLIRLNRP